MSKYNYASAETIVNMIREKAFSLVEDTADRSAKGIPGPFSLDYIGGAVRMANIIIDEMQKDDSDDGK